jgi:hypothetical protein
MKMHLKKKFKGYEFDIPVPWGTSDNIRCVGKNLYVVTNATCGYAYLYRLDPVEWNYTVWPNALRYAERYKDEIRKYGHEWQVAMGYHLTSDRVIMEDLWDTISGGPEHEVCENFGELLSRIPKKDRPYYGCMIDLIRDYPRKWALIVLGEV